MAKIIFLGGEDVSARIEISKQFMELGYNVSIIGSEKEDRFNQNNIEYKKYFLNRELNIINDLKTIQELKNILENEPKDTIVHAFDTKPTMYLPISSWKLKNIKVVRTITGMGRIFTEDSVQNKILRFTYNIIQKIISKRVDFTIFQNDDDHKYYLDKKLINDNKGQVIKSSGIDLAKVTQETNQDKLTSLKKEIGIENNQITFILVSRIVKQKGVLDFLEAAKLCYKKGYKYNFLLVGQMDTKTDGISKVVLDSFSSYVKYLGRREDIPALLSISDIFVLPTYYREGVPRVLLEASAIGLALITTSVPGCKDVVIDDYNGKLINIKDANDLYLKMVYIAENKDLLQRYSTNAKIKVDEFDLNKVVEQYDKVYNNILKDENANTIS